MPIEQQLFDRMSEVLTLNGIPDNNTDMASVIYSITGQNVERHLSGERVTFSNFETVRDAYRDHRSSHRIATFGDHIWYETGFMYLGRSSTSQSSRVMPMIYDWASQLNRTVNQFDQLKSLPFVITEQNRFDRNPMNNDGSEKHATVQLLNLPGMTDVDATTDMNQPTIRAMNRVNVSLDQLGSLGSSYFRVEKYEEVIADTVSDLESEGWSLVKRTFSYRENGATSEVELVIGAIAPDTIGRHAVCLFDVGHYLYGVVALAEILIDLYDGIPDLESEEPTDETLAAISIIQQARAAVAGIRRNITTLRDGVRNRQAELDNLLTSVANNNRMLTDERRQLNEMEIGIERVAMQSVMDIANVPAMVEQFRQVNTATISTEGDSMWLEIITHPFGMRVPPGRYRTEDGAVREQGDSSLYVVPANLRINLMESSWSRAILVGPAEGNERWHPHVSGASGPCWGRAATPMAEAWGRRDWESFIRFLLGWMTQYDANEIYTYIHTIIDLRGMAPRTGWLLPDEDGNVPQPVNAVELEEEEYEDLDEEGLRFEPIEA